MSDAYKTIDFSGLDDLAGIGGRSRRRQAASRPGSVTVGQLRVGERVRVVGNSNTHSYQLGRTYEVAHIDPSDSTVRARDPQTGVVGNWLRVVDLDRAAGVGWDWLKTVLPPDDVALLERFDGLEQLRLKRSVQQALVSALPDLPGAIVNAGGGR